MNSKLTSELIRDELQSFCLTFAALYKLILISFEFSLVCGTIKNVVSNVAMCQLKFNNFMGIVTTNNNCESISNCHHKKKKKLHCIKQIRIKNNSTLMRIGLDAICRHRSKRRSSRKCFTFNQNNARMYQSSPTLPNVEAEVVVCLIILINISQSQSP
ncbi:CLUMA_CG013159, isoform A [Clunio marinus]|uniref:CLUMA_CG013159, isoform A n=1 Tax=Clunio marinus TaxID=568069 RepID=A0A1J1II29_9DIPT|nr:CLUMA_CG013159, isoform A [Clunio marinus]